jgi:hypothetical protein
MDSEKEKELEEKIEEVFENAIQLITDKDNMAEWSLFTKISFYVCFTLLFFIIGVFSIVKKIILFRFLQIPFEFKTMGKLDGVLRKYLMF